MKKNVIILFIITIVITMISLAGCGAGSSPSGNADEYITALKEKVNSEITCFGETVTDVSIENGAVTFSVDMSTADTSSFGDDDIAEVIFLRITGAALEITDYDGAWNSMKVDFGKMGSITKTKDDIMDEDSVRHFAYEPETSWD